MGLLVRCTLRRRSSSRLRPRFQHPFPARTVYISSRGHFPLLANDCGYGCVVPIPLPILHAHTPLSHTPHTQSHGKRVSVAPHGSGLHSHPLAASRPSQPLALGRLISHHRLCYVVPSMQSTPFSHRSLLFGSEMKVEARARMDTFRCERSVEGS